MRWTSYRGDRYIFLLEKLFQYKFYRFKNFVLDVMMGTIGGPMQAKPINGVMRKKYGEAFPDAMELAAMVDILI